MGVRRGRPEASSSAVTWLRERSGRNQYASTGTIVRATSSEASRASELVMANGRNSSPTWPPTSASGRKTATVVRVEAVIAVATSRTPVSTASDRRCPSPRWRWMFSITTMESSTTRPIAIVRAPRVSMLSE